jgi:uncharacterized damage-inducible protein DinB
MKTLTLGLMLLLFSGAMLAQPLTKAERKAAVKYMKWTNKELKKSLKGLSEAQLNFKPSPDAWSAKDCLYHIAFSEGAIRGGLDKSLETPADPAVRSEIKMTDDQIKKMITDRSNKVKTQAPFEPENTGFTSYDEAMAAFKSKRAALMKMIKKSDADMRNRAIPLPFGKVDAYQFALFVAGHTYRHTLQINELKNAEGYPQS